MTQETVVAIYDDVLHIEAACAELTALGVSDDAISWTGAPIGGAPIGGAPIGGAPTHARPARERSFWSTLFGGEPAHDTGVYDRCIESGCNMLTVRANAEHVAEVMAILERHKPVDIEERGAGHARGEPVSDAGNTVYGSGEAVMSLSEERMSVGTRLVDRGTTRVRRFVIETPVAEEVTLRAERVVVERRPVADGVAAAPEFTDRVVEMRETDEEAVVGKTAHVAEEVTLRKVASDRVETVRGTVRREEVEITRDDAAATVPRAKI